MVAGPGMPWRTTVIIVLNKTPLPESVSPPQRARTLPEEELLFSKTPVYSLVFNIFEWQCAN